MPEHLRALTVIIALAIITFFIVFRAFSPCFDETELRRRAFVWLSLTAVTFLAYNPWVYVVGSLLVLWLALQREHNIFALYFTLLFATPQFDVQIPGFGLVNYVADLNHVRLLALTLLLPACLHLRRQPGVLPLGSLWADRLLLAYVVFTVLMHLRGNSATATSTMRVGIYAFLSVLLPYYVASRGPRTMQGLREAMGGFVVATMLLSTIGFFEYLQGWLLYTPLTRLMGGNLISTGNYLLRDGLLRASASTGQAIALGFMVMVGLGFHLYIRHFLPAGRWRNTVFCLLIIGLLAPLSRGPWIGAMVLIVAYVGLGVNPVKGLGRLAICGSVIVAGMLLLPFGQRLINMLPYIGTVDAGNVDYRERLFENSMRVIDRNYYFGSVDYLDAPELKAVQLAPGVVDIVNSYIGITLEFGIVGLCLFVAFFVCVLGSLLQVRLKSGSLAPEQRELSRTLIAVLLAILVTIVTVSSISMIPIVYFAVAGLAVAVCTLPPSKKAPTMNTTTLRASPSIGLATMTSCQS